MYNTMYVNKKCQLHCINLVLYVSYGANTNKKGIYKHCIANSDMSAIMRVYVYMYFLDFFLIYKHSSSCMHVLVTSWNNLFSIFVFSSSDRRQ